MTWFGILWILFALVTAAFWLVCWLLDHPIVLRIDTLRRFGIAGFCCYPFIVVADDLAIPHEIVHWIQQRGFVVRASFLGLLVWVLLYLFVLPVGWNPFRQQWETEAYRVADHLSNEEIRFMLYRSPYHLWFFGGKLDD